jgi:hypothetical protein
MDIPRIEDIERNTLVLKKTLNYVNGEVKEVVERQIKSNILQLNDLLDEYEREYNSIQSYEGGQNGN